jgi:hypothetical protein
VAFLFEPSKRERRRSSGRHGQTLADAGIREILVVTGGRNSRRGEGGIADALALTEHFAGYGTATV